MDWLTHLPNNFLHKQHHLSSDNCNFNLLLALPPLIPFFIHTHIYDLLASFWKILGVPGCRGGWRTVWPICKKQTNWLTVITHLTNFTLLLLIPLLIARSSIFMSSSHPSGRGSVHQVAAVEGTGWHMLWTICLGTPSLSSSSLGDPPHFHLEIFWGYSGSDPVVCQPVSSSSNPPI